MKFRVLMSFILMIFTMVMLNGCNNPLDFWANSGNTITTSQININADLSSSAQSEVFFPIPNTNFCINRAHKYTYHIALPENYNLGDKVTFSYSMEGNLTNPEQTLTQFKSNIIFEFIMDYTDLICMTIPAPWEDVSTNELYVFEYTLEEENLEELTFITSFMPSQQYLNNVQDVSFTLNEVFTFEPNVQ